MTWKGEIEDGSYWLVLDMPCHAEIQSIKMHTYGSAGPGELNAIQHQIFKGTLGGITTACCALTSAEPVNGDAVVTNASVSEHESLWVEMTNYASGVTQMTALTVIYRPSPRFFV